MGKMEQNTDILKIKIELHVLDCVQVYGKKQVHSDLHSF